MVRAVRTARLATSRLKSLWVVGTPSVKNMTIFFAPCLAWFNAFSAASMPWSAGVAPTADRLFTDDLSTVASLVSGSTAPEFRPNRVMAMRTLLFSSRMVALVAAVASMKLSAAVFNASRRLGFASSQPSCRPFMQKSMEPEVSRTSTTSILEVISWVSRVSLPTTSRFSVYLPPPL